MTILVKINVFSMCLSGMKEAKYIWTKQSVTQNHDMFKFQMTTL